MTQLNLTFEEPVLSLEITDSDALELTIQSEPIPVIELEINEAFTAVNEGDLDAPDFLLLYQIAKL